MSTSAAPPDKPAAPGEPAADAATEGTGEPSSGSHADSGPAPGRDGPIYWVAFDPLWLRRGVIAVITILLIVNIGLWIFHSVSSFLFLLLIAWLFGIALEPIVGFFARRGMRRGLATGIAMAAFFAGAVIFVLAFGDLLITQLAQLITALPTIIDKTADWASDMLNKEIDPQAIAKQFNITPAQAASWASNLAGGVLGIISSTVNVVFQAFTMLLFAFYFSADGPRLRRTIASWLPTQRQPVFATVWDITVQKTGAFVVSRLLLALLSAFFMAIFLLIIGVPYWLPLGLFTGIVSQFIPTIGTYLGIILPCLVAVFNDPIDVVWIIIFGTAYQQIENYFFSPKISAATLDIHPAIAFGSVIVGAALFGAMGAIIAIPIAAAITAIVDTYGQRYELIPQLAETQQAKVSRRAARRAKADTLPVKDYERELHGKTDISD